MGKKPFQAHPVLANSIKSIHVVMLEHQSKHDELLYNFRASNRGALCRPPSILTWVQSVKQLRDQGLSIDLQSIVKKFNVGTPKQRQLVGQKAIAVRNLLEAMPPKALEVIETHVQKMGWDRSVFSDDALGSRKILPNFVHRNHNLGGSWAKWGKMSEESTLLLLRHVTTVYEGEHEKARRKLTKAELEDKSEEAAFVLNIGLTAQSD